MKMRERASGCASHAMTRRGFLAAGCRACAGVAGLLAAPRLIRAGDDSGKVRIRVVYALFGAKQPRPTWPHVGFDFVPVMDAINADLAKRCPRFELVSAMAQGPEDARKILDEDRSAAIDGYLVYQMNNWCKVVRTIAASGKPVLFADFKYGGSGGFLVNTAAFLRSKASSVGFMASPGMDDLVEAVKCFQQVKKGAAPGFAAATAQVRIARTPKPGDLTCKPDSLKPLSPEDCIRRLRESRIVAARDSKTSGPGAPIAEIPLEYVTFAEVNDAWKAADKDEAKAIADRWRKTAKSVVDVTPETLESSAAMYLGMKAILKKRGANAITMNCLGGFYGGHIHAYPCLGFHELCNEGLVGACECDLRSAATMVIMAALTQGRPGFISDPVIDTSTRRIIYAHCVASNKVFGPQGEANPFEILTHSEDRKGASVRSILPPGYMTTTFKINQDRKEFLFHQAKAVGNDPDDRACRTKLVAEPVGDIEKLFTAWDQWGWHRVTCYGDLKAPVSALAETMGWKVVQEA